VTSDFLVHKQVKTTGDTLQGPRLSGALLSSGKLFSSFPCHEQRYANTIGHRLRGKPTGSFTSDGSLKIEYQSTPGHLAEGYRDALRETWASIAQSADLATLVSLSGGIPWREIIDDNGDDAGKPNNLNC